MGFGLFGVRGGWQIPEDPGILTTLGNVIPQELWHLYGVAEKCLPGVSEKGDYEGSELHATKEQSLADMSGREVPEEPSLVDYGGLMT